MYIRQLLLRILRFEIKGPIRNIVCCHCSQCRKEQGSAFATNGIVSTADFDIVSGADSPIGYESTPGPTKYFCQTCGSTIMGKINRPICACVGAVFSFSEQAAQ